jgi:hypothetical protein
MHYNILKKAFLLLLLSFVNLSLLTSSKTPSIIALQDEKIAFKPTGFYVAAVEDGRSGKNAIAQLLNKTSSGKMSVQATDLQGGPVSAIDKFMDRNLLKDQSQRPIVINIKELKITETQLDANRASGNVRLSLTFGLQKDYGTEILVNYQGGFNYIRLTYDVADVELHLRKTLINSLIFFNNWMKVNTPTNVKLARKVIINFKDYEDKHEGDTIYYKASRPLTFADFQSKYTPRNPTYAAGVMPSIGYDEQAKTVDGTIYISIEMKAYLPKSTCWVRYGYKDDYTLNHEQRHFDVVKIIAEQYKQKVLSAGLTPDNYEAFINMQYLDSYGDMNAMQEAYDKETSHGRDTYAQARWNDKIDKLLKTDTRL